MPMLRLFYALLLVMVALGAYASGLGAEWMSHPAPDDSSEVWFRRTFVGTGRPLKMSVSVATTGRFVLYVNGRNVSTALHLPFRADGDTSAVDIAFDVTRYLRRDTNTVAVLYSPSMATRRQVGVACWGIDAAGARFASHSADGWVCRRGSACLSGVGERVDGTVADVPWGRVPVEAALWLPVSGVGDDGPLPVPMGRGYSAVRVLSVRVPRYFDTPPDGSPTVTYDFSPGFCGSVRLTLRGCRRGQVIRVGDTSYTCSGEMDEQLFCRFAMSYMRRVTVTGDGSFRPEQVQCVEAQCVVCHTPLAWSR